MTMAVVDIFGLAFATGLTLVVVPVLVSLAESGRRRLVRLPRSLAWWWWGLFDRRHGTNYAARWAEQDR